MRGNYRVLEAKYNCELQLREMIACHCKLIIYLGSSFKQFMADVGESSGKPDKVVVNNKNEDSRNLVRLRVGEVNNHRMQSVLLDSLYIYTHTLSGAFAVVSCKLCAKSNLLDATLNYNMELRAARSVFD